jgi:hypothetical protein
MSASHSILPRDERSVLTLLVIPHGGPQSSRGISRQPLRDLYPVWDLLLNVHVLLAVSAPVFWSRCTPHKHCCSTYDDRRCDRDVRARNHEHRAQSAAVYEPLHIYERFEGRSCWDWFSMYHWAGI